MFDLSGFEVGARLATKVIKTLMQQKLQNLAAQLAIENFPDIQSARNKTCLNDQNNRFINE